MMKCPKCEKEKRCCTCYHARGRFHPDCSIYEAAASIADVGDVMLGAHDFGCQFWNEGGHEERRIHEMSKVWHER